MEREQKLATVASMRAQFEQQSIVTVFHYIGMTVSETDDVRCRMREVGASFQVTKNRLALRALNGTQHESLSDYLKGPTAIVSSSDPVATAKAIVATTKANPKLVIVSASVAGQVIDRNALGDLATMPSLDEFRAKIMGLLSAPATKIVSVLPRPATNLVSILQAPAREMVGVLKAQGETDGAA